MTAYSTVSLDEMLARQSAESRQKIEQMASELIAEEANLRELRRLRKMTQARLAKKMKIGQEGVSRIERRKDMNISTLVSYVEGIGGRLSLVVDMPGQRPFVISTSKTGKGKKDSKKKAKTAAKSKPAKRRAA